MGESNSKAGSGKLHAYYLKYWMRTRGPLFERARMAALRALAVGEVLVLSRIASDRRLRMRAARAMRAHQDAGTPSKSPATQAQFEAARKMCADLRRISREAAHLHFVRQGEIVADMLRKYDGEGRDEYDWQMDHGWAELICGVLFAREDAVRLRAAVTLLCWTDPDARKVGYLKQLSEEDLETLEEVRADAGVPAKSPERPWGPPAQCAGGANAPEIQARGRNGP